MTVRMKYCTVFQRIRPAIHSSDKNSHVLVMRLLLLALSPVYSSQRNATLAGGFQDIVRWASHIQVGPVCMPSWQTSRHMLDRITVPRPRPDISMVSFALRILSCTCASQRG